MSRDDAAQDDASTALPSERGVAAPDRRGSNRSRARQPDGPQSGLTRLCRTLSLGAEVPGTCSLGQEPARITGPAARPRTSRVSSLVPSEESRRIDPKGASPQPPSIFEERTKARRQTGPARPCALSISFRRALPSPVFQGPRIARKVELGGARQPNHAMCGVWPVPNRLAGSIFTPGPMVEEIATRLMKCPWRPPASPSAPRRRTP